jgi:hypothetical protein
MSQHPFAGGCSEEPRGTTAAGRGDEFAARAPKLGIKRVFEPRMSHAAHRVGIDQYGARGRRNPRAGESDFGYHRAMSEIIVPVSPGELIDKMTILRIKTQRITDAAKLKNVRLELDALQATWAKSSYAAVDIGADESALLSVNERLWIIEDEIREKERAQAFDAEFIRLARAVYFENDERAAIKRRINLRLGSAIIEEKSYSDYRSKVYSAPQ